MFYNLGNTLINLVEGESCFRKSLFRIGIGFVETAGGFDSIFIGLGCGW